MQYYPRPQGRHQIRQGDERGLLGHLVDVIGFDRVQVVFVLARDVVIGGEALLLLSLCDAFSSSPPTSSSRPGQNLGAPRDPARPAPSPPPRRCETHRSLRQSTRPVYCARTRAPAGGVAPRASGWTHCDMSKAASGKATRVRIFSRQRAEQRKRFRCMISTSGSRQGSMVDAAGRGALQRGHAHISANSSSRENSFRHVARGTASRRGPRTAAGGYELIRIVIIADHHRDPVPRNASSRLYNGYAPAHQPVQDLQGERRRERLRGDLLGVACPGGGGCFKQAVLACKVRAWYSAALRDLPALWYGKLEDDHWVSIGKLAFDLRNLAGRARDSADGKKLQAAVNSVTSALRFINVDFPEKWTGVRFKSKWT